MSGLTDVIDGVDDNLSLLLTGVADESDAMPRLLSPGVRYAPEKKNSAPWSQYSLDTTSRVVSSPLV